MEGKTVLRASVSGTINPKDEKDPEVSCPYFLYLLPRFISLCAGIRQ